MADKQYQLDFTMTDGSVKSVTFVSPEGPQGERGLQGEPGFSPQVAVEPAAGGDGKTGVKLSITDAESTKNIYIYNGADGAPGADGADGFSPTVEVEPYSVISPPLEGSTEITTESGHIVTITDKEGAKQFYVLNGTPGVSPTVEVQGWGEVGEDDVERTGYELTITDKNGTESIILKNGDPGVSPTVEVQGWGEVGEDNVERTGYELTITDKTGTKNIILMNGEQGPKGETGDQGPEGVPGFSPRVSVEPFEETGEGGTRLTGNEITIVAANGNQIFRVYNGADGKDGEDGVDGGGNGADQEPLIVTVEPYYETDEDAQEVEVGYQVTIEDASGPQDFVIRHGKTGAQGPQGSDGKSAYAYAQEGGFTGTEEEFAEALAGVSYTDGILPPTELTEAGDAAAAGIEGLYDQLIPGEMYMVQIDGVRYKCEARETGAGTIVMDAGAFSVLVAQGGHADGSDDVSVFRLDGVVVPSATLAIYGAEEVLPESVDEVIINSSTAGSTKKFKLTVDDSGTLTVTEVTQ